MEKKIDCSFGDEVVIREVSRAIINMTVDNGDSSSWVSLSVTDARKIARALDAFAEILS